MTKTGLRPSQSTFAGSFYGIFTQFFPEAQADGGYDAEEDNEDQLQLPVFQPALVAQPPVIHKPYQELQKMSPPETFRIDSVASIVNEPQECESVYLTAASVATNNRNDPSMTQHGPGAALASNNRNDPSMTQYGPAPADLNSFHRTSFTWEQDQIRQLQLQNAELQQQLQQAQQRQLELQRQTQQQQAQQQQRAQQQQAQQQQQQQAQQQRAQQQQAQQQQQQQAQQQQKAQQKPNPDTHKANSEGAQLTMGELLDQHVAYYLSQHPDIAASRKVLRKRAGCYEINGKDVKLDWEHNDPSGGQGYLVVIDGQSREAFSEYVRKSCAKVQKGTQARDAARERYEQSKIDALNHEQPARDRYEQSKIDALNYEQPKQEATKAGQLLSPLYELYEQSKQDVIKAGQILSPQALYTPSPLPAYTLSPQPVCTPSSQPVSTGAPAVYNSGVYNSGYSGVYNSGIYSSAVYNSGIFPSQVALR